MKDDIEQLRAQAQAHIARADSKAATAACRALLELDPQQPIALRWLAYAAAQAGELDRAADLYRRLLQAEPGDALAAYNLGQAESLQRRWAEAAQAFGRARRIDDSMLLAWLNEAHSFERLGDTRSSALRYLRATRLADALPAQQLPVELRRFLNHALGVIRQFMGAELDAALEPLAGAHGREAVARIARGARGFAGLEPINFAHPKWRPGLYYVPGLPPKPFFDRREFAWAERVEAATAVIRQELLTVLDDGTGLAPYVDHAQGTHGARVWAGINRSPDWSAFHFYRHGQRIDANCARCPQTAALLDSLDLMRVPGYGPEAMYSVLRPRSRIPPHYGTVNGRLIVHLPLIVPPDCGALRAAGIEHRWVEGELMVFDDAFEHEAWNDSDQTRVVLIFDTWNPALSEAERAAFTAVLGRAQALEQAALAV